MSKSKHEIKMDYEKAKQQAEKLEEAAEDLNRLQEYHFCNTLQQIANNWQGDSANAYINKGKTLQENMKTTATDLFSIAKAIKEIARQIYEAEMENYRREHEKHHH